MYLVHIQCKQINTSGFKCFNTLIQMECILSKCDFMMLIFQIRWPRAAIGDTSLAWNYGASIGTWYFCNQNQFCVHKIEFCHNKIIFVFYSCVLCIFIFEMTKINNKIFFFFFSYVFYHVNFIFEWQKQILLYKNIFRRTKIIFVDEIQFCQLGMQIHVYKYKLIWIQKWLLLPNLQIR